MTELTPEDPGPWNQPIFETFVVVDIRKGRPAFHFQAGA